MAAAIVCSDAKVATEQVWRDRIDLVEREGLGPVQAASSARWFGKATAEHPTDESRAVLAELLDVDPAGYCQACAALETFDVRDRLPQMQVPLLAVAGADDIVTTAEQNLELGRPRSRVAVRDAARCGTSRAAGGTRGNHNAAAEPLRRRRTSMSTGISTGPNLVQSEVENPDASMR